MSETAIKIENLKKQYKLGAIGGQTLNAELQSWWARKRGKTDPNLKLGEDTSRYGERFYALDDINLEIKKGEAIGIIGSNGAGKSTLLKILSRVTAPTEGDVWIDGRIASMLEVGTGFHAELTGRENIYMNGAILGMTRKEVDEKIESIIDFSECRQFIDTPVKRYSSGMYVKLAFAVASHLDAEILIMDEVLAVGDMDFQKKCLSKMGDDAHGGKTVLYVSHNMSTIRNLCNRCVVLDKGRIIFDGSTEEAIDIYLGAIVKELPSTYDFTSLKRPDPEAGTIVFLDRFMFLEKKDAVFNADEEMKIKVEWHAIKPVKDVRIRMAVYRLDNTPVGMAFSNEGISSDGGEHWNTEIVLKDLRLSDGIYFCWLEASYIGATVIGLDYPPEKIYFQIRNSSVDFLWKTAIWGNVQYYDNMKIIRNSRGKHDDK